MESIQFSVWPAIPVHYQVVPAHLENAVKEGKYHLLHHLHPPSMTCSTYAIHQKGAPDTSPGRRPAVLLRPATLAGDPDGHHTARPAGGEHAHDPLRHRNQSSHRARHARPQSESRRAEKHWHQYAVRGEFEPPFEDRPVPPLLLKPDDHDDDGTTAWTLRLTAEQAARAEREYRRVREMKARALSYFRRHTPMPMAWAPLDREAWNEEDRDRIRRGLLFNSYNWKPLYRGWELEDVPFKWEDPDKSEDDGDDGDDDMTDESRAQFEQRQREHEERRARRERQEALMKEIENRRGN